MHIIQVGNGKNRQIEIDEFEMIVFGETEAIE
jgi:hypothetical protein